MAVGAANHVKLYLIPTRRFATTCIWFPLAAGATAICLSFMAWGLVDLASVGKSEGAEEGLWEDVELCVLGTFKVVTALAGLVMAVGLQLASGAHMLYVACMVYMVASTIKLGSQWLEWITALTGNSGRLSQAWEPTTSDVLTMVWCTTRWLLYCFISFSWILSVLGSLEKVLSVGGTGWEKEDYLQVLRRQLQLQQELEQTQADCQRRRRGEPSVRRGSCNE